MISKLILFIGISTLILTVACSPANPEKSPEEIKYKTCVESEISKLLDETGSNFDSANQSAKQTCASLKPDSLP